MTSLFPERITETKHMINDNVDDATIEAPPAKRQRKGRRLALGIEGSANKIGES